MEQLRNISSILLHTNQKVLVSHAHQQTLHFSLLSMYGLVLVINHSVYLDLRFETASQKHQGGTHS